MGYEINNKILYTFKFGDDQVGIGQCKNDIETMAEEYSEQGLDVNINKTKYMSFDAMFGDLELAD